MNGASPKNVPAVIFVSLPESSPRRIGEFAIDPSILLPVEVSYHSPEESIKNVTTEMILSGMLKVIGFMPDHPHIDYYRNFVMAIRPDIVSALQASAAQKAKNGEYDLSEEFFTILVGLTPGDTDAALNLALLLEQRAEIYDKLQNTDVAEDYRLRADSIYRSLTGSYTAEKEITLRYATFLMRWGKRKQGREVLRAYRDGSPRAMRRTQLPAFWMPWK